MTEVVIRNKTFLNKLNEFVDEFFSFDAYEDTKYRVTSPDEIVAKGEYYCSDEWLYHMLEKWETHEGYPEQYMSQALSKMAGKDPEKYNEFYNKWRKDFTLEIGAMHSALLSYYPTGGFVGWHTNWNANAYQVLFTWSKSGNGYFRYYDKQKDEIVTIQDKPGWQCRHFYFGRKDEPDHHCWHAAYAGEPRITLAYKFANYSLDDPINDNAIYMRDCLIDEIESEG